MRSVLGNHASNDGKVMIFGCGVPVMYGDAVIGAIGVSGALGKRYQAVAEAGAEPSQAN